MSEKNNGHGGAEEFDFSTDLEPLSREDLDVLGAPDSDISVNKMIDPDLLDHMDAASDATLEAGVEPLANKSSNKTKMVIVAVVSVMIMLLILLGYFAWNALTPKAPSHRPADIGNPQIGATNQSGQSSNSALETANGIASSLGGELEHSNGNPDPLIVEEALGGAAKESVEGGHLAGTPRTPGGVSAEGQQANNSHAAAPSQTSEEEAEYDRLLNQAGKLDVPNGAIKIDPGVVSQMLERKRLEKLDGDMKSTRSDVDEVKKAVNTMQSKVAEISSAVSASQAINEKMMGAIDALTKDFAVANKKHEEELAALRKKIDGVGSQARPVTENSVAQPKRDPIKPAPANQQLVANKQQTVQRSKPAHSAPVALPSPTAVRGVTAPAVAERSVLPPQCDGRFVSSNWRVKGINESSAYVVRAQDGAGILVRAGMIIPGFGEVQSFDRLNRSICTSQGLVKR